MTSRPRCSCTTTARYGSRDGTELPSTSTRGHTPWIELTTVHRIRAEVDSCPGTTVTGGQEFMRKTRRNHSAAIKARVALAAIRDEKTFAEIATHHEVHPIQVTSWKARLLQNAAGVIGGEWRVATSGRRSGSGRPGCWGRRWLACTWHDRYPSESWC